MNVFDDLKMPKVVYDITSKLNGRIRVVDVGKTRKLIVDNSIQSINVDSPACSKLFLGQLVNSLKRRVTDPSSIHRILILGMGGGTMATLLSRTFPGVEITSVEYDKVMVDIAKKFFDLDSIPNHKIIVDNALKVVVEPESFDIVPASFNAVIVDIFNGEEYPDLGETGNFISAVKSLVAPGGYLIFNRVYTEDHQEDVNLFIQDLEEFIGDTETEIVAGYTNSDNILVFGRV